MTGNFLDDYRFVRLVRDGWRPELEYFFKRALNLLRPFGVSGEGKQIVRVLAPLQGAVFLA